MNSLALWLTGFSVFASLALLGTLATETYRGQTLVRLFGGLTLLSLGAVQGAHALWLQHARSDLNLLQYPLYLMALLMVGPSFHGLCRALLEPAQLQAAGVLHFTPVFLPWLMPQLAFPLAFGLGTVYLTHLIFRISKFHQERTNYPFEVGFLSTAAIIGLVVVIWGLLHPSLAESNFIEIYATGIGAIFFLVIFTLLMRPQLAAVIQETAQNAKYAQSTLKNQDCSGLLVQLELLMVQEKLYADPQIQMKRVAHRLGISAHQLSELVNRQLGKGFSRYLRECRIEAAKAMLIAQPQASVLSVGLDVGFTSSSNFYDAFRELEGMTPGQFRKLHQAPTTDR